MKEDRIERSEIAVSYLRLGWRIKLVAVSNVVKWRWTSPSGKQHFTDCTDPVVPNVPKTLP